VVFEPDYAAAGCRRGPPTATELFGQGEGVFGLGPVGEVAAGLLAQRSVEAHRARTRPGHRRHDEPSHDQGGRASRRAAADQRPRATLGRLLGAEPRRDAPGRRRDWHGAWAALERLADHHRHRGDRHRPQERPGRLRGDIGWAERDGR